MKTPREPSKPFVIRHVDLPKEVFAKQFLASHDFDLSSLRAISKQCGLGTSGSKKNLLDKLEVYFFRNNSDREGQVIIEQLVRRNKNWFAFRTGKCPNIPRLQNPTEIIFSPGKSGWYGPVLVDGENWFVHVSFMPQWEFDEISKQFQEYRIRWLCFARVSEDCVSLHWQGFTIADNRNQVDHENQFRYWEHIPTCFDEIQKTLNAKLSDPLLHNLVLHDLWDEFRLNPSYEWEDLRIRAESGGVSLNVQSPGKSASDDAEINISNIKHLAKTLSLSAAKELKLYPLKPEMQTRLEETILRTLIREFGAKSYEFSLASRGKKILRAHFYFGAKPKTPSRDCFPHVNCFAQWGSDKEQFHFILQYLKSGYANHQPRQSSFLE